ncbi:hypothetical protein GOBAR_AA39073 [Gossypium barbadense]|uniref:Uncharacterized protein n=1 Tax=Gossypium barbadense TaxID=3634 RepID=A0A2P5VS34_GOSBA|nr:hypothetical protein GOBAR_AA39073 [Gossypium barbadense]
MELVDDDNLETMLFVELADVEPTKNLILLGEEHRAQELCMVVPISYVNSQSTVRRIYIDFNAALETNVVGDNGYNSSDPSDHEVDSDSDLDVDEVMNDIDDEGVNDDENVNTSLTTNQIRRIVIHNNPRAYMSLIDHDTMHVTEFQDYFDIILAHRLAVDFDPEELFVGQKFETTFYKLTPLMPKIGQQQVNQMEAGHVFVKDVRDAMVTNCRRARLMNIEICLRHLGMFRVKKTIDRRLGIPPRSYGVYLQNRRCDCRGFKHFIILVRTLWKLVRMCHSMLNSLSMRCTLSSACCVFGRTSSSSYLTYPHGRCLRLLLSLSQTKGLIDI